ncbi:hypothetical protein [Marinomonas gallaica]|uniref:hypothetical protein n=1 Tax=Marinomonas gallaica TaxID=1806667 RepID=UPI003A906768
MKEFSQEDKVILPQELISFKEDCINLDDEVVVQKHLIDGGSYFFDLYYNQYEEFKFKKLIASSLDVHIRDIAIVGSGKLGFSIKPDNDTPGFYPFKSFDFNFDKDNERQKSDLDVAIVSSSLFDEQLLSIYEHTDCYMDSVFKGRNSLGKYVLKGWIRPDLLPSEYKISPTIESIRNDLEKEYERDVNIGIYKSWRFFESYHKGNVWNIKLNLIA